MHRAIPIFSAILLTLAFLLGPFVHVHLDSDHGDDHHAGAGAIVHAHLPGTPEDAAPEQPTLAGNGHAGDSVDFLLLLAGKALLFTGLSPAAPDLIPVLLFAGKLTAARQARARDPALSALPPRAPPA